MNFFKLQHFYLLFTPFHFDFFFLFLTLCWPEIWDDEMEIQLEFSRCFDQYIIKQTSSSISTLDELFYKLMDSLSFVILINDEPATWACSALDILRLFCFISNNNMVFCRVIDYSVDRNDLNIDEFTIQDFPQFTVSIEPFRIKHFSIDDFICNC